MNDPNKFPDDEDDEVSLRVFQTPQFAALCGQIFRRCFRVYGIIYSSFFGTLEALDMAPHLNTCFKHFLFFCTEFGLLPEREMEPLEVLVKPIRKQYYAAKQGKWDDLSCSSPAIHRNWDLGTYIGQRSVIESIWADHEKLSHLSLLVVSSRFHIMMVVLKVRQ